MRRVEGVRGRMRCARRSARQDVQIMAVVLSASINGRVGELFVDERL